jgi:hypothetical protein
MIVPNSPFEWFSQHIQTVAWPAVFLVIWRVSRWVTQLTATAGKTIKQIDTLATNHMPHIEASLANQDKLMETMTLHLAKIADNSGRRRENF